MTNNVSLYKSIERDALLAKKNRKQRRKAEQAAVKAQQLPEIILDPPDFSDRLEAEVEEDAGPEGGEDLDLDAFEPIDFDDIRGAW
jgi:hypothetical protein